MVICGAGAAATNPPATGAQAEAEAKPAEEGEKPPAEEAP